MNNPPSDFGTKFFIAVLAIRVHSLRQDIAVDDEHGRNVPIDDIRRREIRQIRDIARLHAWNVKGAEE